MKPVACLRHSPTSAECRQAADVRDGRLSLQEQLQQFISPQKYAANVMQGAKYAWGKTNVPPKDTMFVADPTAARQWLSNEWNLGINSDWLPSIRTCQNTVASIVVHRARGAEVLPWRDYPRDLVRFQSHCIVECGMHDIATQQVLLYMSHTMLPVCTMVSVALLLHLTVLKALCWATLL